MAKRPETPADIATALSPSQRKALLWLPADGTPRAWDAAPKDGRPREVSLYVLRNVIWGHPEREAATCAQLCRQERDDDHWLLTPLGQAVRAVLAAGERHG